MTFEEWGPIKAAGTYGANCQLPAYVDDNGVVFNQSNAILKMLCMEHGYAPQTSKALFEAEWYCGVAVDVLEKPERMVMMVDGAEAEKVQVAIDIFAKFIDKVEERCADGRAHSCGDHITFGDFMLLQLMTSVYENPNLKHAAMKEQLTAKMAACPNVNRVMAPMKELCAAQIAALAPSFI